jgi:hypothetical protein
LSAGVRAISLSIKANAQQLPDQKFAEEVRRELQAMRNINDHLLRRLLD